MCRSRRDLSNAYLLAKIGVDTAENEPLEVWGENSIQYSLHSLFMPGCKGTQTVVQHVLHARPVGACAGAVRLMHAEIHRVVELAFFLTQIERNAFKASYVGGIVAVALPLEAPQEVLYGVKFNKVKIAAADVLVVGVVRPDRLVLAADAGAVSGDDAYLNNVSKEANELMHLIQWFMSTAAKTVLFLATKLSIWTPTAMTRASLKYSYSKRRGLEKH